MNTTVKHRGYDGAIIHDPEDQIYYGKVLGIRGIISYHGDTPEQAEQIFREAVDEYLTDCERDGITPQVPFENLTLDVPDEYRVRAALYAEEHDMKLKNVLETALDNLFARAA